MSSFVWLFFVHQIVFYLCVSNGKKSERERERDTHRDPNIYVCSVSIENNWKCDNT